MKDEAGETSPHEVAYFASGVLATSVVRVDRCFDLLV